MNQLPFRRVLTTLAVFVILAVLTIFLDQRGYLDPVRDGMGEIISPVASRLQSAIGLTLPESEMANQLATVTAERDDLRAENARLQGELNDVAVYRQQLQAEENFPTNNYLAARVIGHDPSGTEQRIVINRGADDGLRVGMAVVDPNYLVGQIVDVEAHRSKVLLISDPTSSVGGMLNGSNADGIVYGDPAGGTQLTMLHLNKNAAVADEQWIVTSDIAQSTTAQVPPYIPIGYVVGTPYLNEQTDELQVTLQPGADLQSLEHVWIVVPQ